MGEIGGGDATATDWGDPTRLNANTNLYKATVTVGGVSYELRKEVTMKDEFGITTQDIRTVKYSYKKPGDLIATNLNIGNIEDILNNSNQNNSNGGNTGGTGRKYKYSWKLK